MVIDDAHKGVFGKCKAVGAHLEDIRQQMRDILEGKATCSLCEVAASHICGSAEKAVFLCAQCAATGHGGCDNVVELTKLEVAVNEARLGSLRPDPELIVGARFVHNTRDKATEWRVDSVDTSPAHWSKWKATLSVAFGSGATKACTFQDLTTKYTATAQAPCVERYFAVCLSWMAAYETTTRSLYGLMAPAAGSDATVDRLSQADVAAVRQFLRDGKIDDIMEHLMKRNQPMRWLPHLSTAPESGVANGHTAVRQPQRRKRTGMKLTTSLLLLQLPCVLCITWLS